MKYETKLNSVSEIYHNYSLSATQWLGTTFTILGALATSAGLDPYNIIFFNLGSLFWLTASIRMKNPALMAVNAALLGIYLLGAIVRVIQ